MWTLFGGSKTPKAPPKVESDLVIPVHRFDDTAIFRSTGLRLMLKFDDVLDPEMLRSSLERLLDREGWRKLGARLRLNDKGKLDYHVPKSYDRQNRPSITYSAVRHDMPIANHELASQLPRATNTLTIFDEWQDLMPLMSSDATPKNLEDFLYKDIPQLGLHVVSFHDATLVSISWSHILADIMGLKALLLAWSLVLNGRDDEVPHLIGFDVDPLEEYGRHPKEEFKLAHKLLSTWQMVVFGLGYAFEQFWWPEEPSRTIFVPASFITALRQNARRELAEQDAATRNPEADAPFLSEGDVLFAWLSKLVVPPVTRNPHQTVNLLNPFDPRTVLSKDLLPAPGVYVGNAAAAMYTHVLVDDIINEPVSAVAAKIRSSIRQLGTREQLEAQAALARAVLERGGLPVVFGDARMHMLICTNWAKARLYETDFSAAAVKGEAGTESSTTTRPSFVTAATVSKGLPQRNYFCVVGKDGHGNFWLNGHLRKAAWLEVERVIASQRV